MSIRRHHNISEQRGLLPDLESCCHRDIGLEGNSVKSNKTAKTTDPAKLCEPTYVPLVPYGMPFYKVRTRLTKKLAESANHSGG